MGRYDSNAPNPHRAWYFYLLGVWSILVLQLFLLLLRG